ncbi:MAG: hypothetical protein IPH35_24075 [Rhodoferax sp.]|nr:hypothetical protein [Rhodoferax sp.]
MKFMQRQFWCRSSAAGQKMGQDKLFELPGSNSSESIAGACFLPFPDSKAIGLSGLVLKSEKNQPEQWVAIELGSKNNPQPVDNPILAHLMPLPESGESLRIWKRLSRTMLHRCAIVMNI